MFASLIFHTVGTHSSLCLNKWLMCVDAWRIHLKQVLPYSYSSLGTDNVRKRIWVHGTGYFLIDFHLEPTFGSPPWCQAWCLYCEQLEDSKLEVRGRDLCLSVSITVSTPTCFLTGCLGSKRLCPHLFITTSWLLLEESCRLSMFPHCCLVHIIPKLNGIIIRDFAPLFMGCRSQPYPER